MFLKKKKGQSMLEYAILMGVIVAVIVALQVYVRRAVQGRFKQSADSIGDQFTTREAYTTQSIQQTARREQTLGTDMGTAGKAWSESKIMTQGELGTDWVGSLGDYQKKAADYKGAEITTTDYVTATAGDGKLGDHATFDSGKLSETTLFDEDSSD